MPHQSFHEIIASYFFHWPSNSSYDLTDGISNSELVNSGIECLNILVLVTKYILNTEMSIPNHFT